MRGILPWCLGLGTVQVLVVETFTPTSVTRWSLGFAPNLCGYF